MVEESGSGCGFGWVFRMMGMSKPFLAAKPAGFRNFAHDSRVFDKGGTPILEAGLERRRKEPFDHFS